MCCQVYTWHYPKTPVLRHKTGASFSSGRFTWLPSTGFQPQLLPVLCALCFLNCLDVRGSCMYRYPFFWRWSWQRSKTSCALATSKDRGSWEAEKAENSWQILEFCAKVLQITCVKCNAAMLQCKAVEAPAYKCQSGLYLGPVKKTENKGSRPSQATGRVSTCTNNLHRYVASLYTFCFCGWKPLVTSLTLDHDL